MARLSSSGSSSETGIALDVITAREEARLAVLGCHILLEPGNGPAMIFDIGGGSTELVLIESTDTVPRILDWQSVPWGVVSLTETFGPEEADRPARELRYAAMREQVAQSFAAFAERVSRSQRAGHHGRYAAAAGDQRHGDDAGQPPSRPAAI